MNNVRGLNCQTNIFDKCLRLPGQVKRKSYSEPSILPLR